MHSGTIPDELLHVGEILAPHGLKGALTIYSHTRPAIGIAGYSSWWVGATESSVRSLDIRRCWQHGKRILAEIEGIRTPEAAAELKGMKIWIEAGDVDLDEDEYLWEELTGCEVRVAGSDALLGHVVALESYGAQDILNVRTPEGADKPGEWMLPFIKEVIADVDLEAGRITVQLPEGMDACFTPRS